MFQSFEEDCIVIGWRFMYVWDGILLKKILTLEGKEIESIYVDEKYLYLNKELKTPLEKRKAFKNYRPNPWKFCFYDTKE